MKRALYLSFVFACVPILFANADDALLKLGDPAPSISSAEAIRGEKVAAFELGTCYVIDFIGTDCAPCVASLPEMHHLSEQFPDTVFISIFSEAERNAIEEFVVKHADNLPQIVLADFDGNVWQRFATKAGMQGIPLIFVVDSKGNVAWTGRPDAIGKQLPSIANGDHSYSENSVLTAARLIEKTSIEIRQAQYKLRDEAERANQRVIELAKEEAYDEIMDLLNQAIPKCNEFDMEMALRCQRVYVSGRIKSGRHQAYELAVDLCGRSLSYDYRPMHTLIGQYEYAFDENRDIRILDLANGFLSLTEVPKQPKTLDIAYRQSFRAHIEFLRGNSQAAMGFVEEALSLTSKEATDEAEALRARLTEMQHKFTPID